MRGSSMTDIGDYNEKLVLQTIRATTGGISQSEVGRRANLSRQSVSLITRRLLAEGLIETAGRRNTGPGKPHTVLRVVPDACLAVGVHLDPAHIMVVVCDLYARPLVKSTMEAPTRSSDRDIARIAARIGELSDSIGAAAPGAETGPEDGAARPVRRRLLGLGIAAPGSLDSTAGTVRRPPWIPWRDVPVAAQLGEACGLPAILDKDTNAALTGEIWSRNLPFEETVLYIYVSHGVGSAVSAYGRVHRGSSTQAGEIGHLPTGRADLRCECGAFGCLNMYTDAHLVVDQARAAGVEVPVGAGIKEEIRAVSRAAESGNAGAQQSIARHGAALGPALRTLSGIHDPERIIIGGPAWPLLARYGMPPIQDALGDWQAGPDAVLESSHLGDDVGAVGAASLILEQELAPANGAARLFLRPTPAV